MLTVEAIGAVDTHPTGMYTCFTCREWDPVYVVHFLYLTKFFFVFTGEKPFQCEYCDKAYTQPHVLKSHHDAVHPDLPFIKSSKKTNTSQSHQPSNYQTLVISQALPDHNETVAEVVEIVNGQSEAVQTVQELTEYPNVLPVTGNVTQQYVVSVFNPL